MLIGAHVSPAGGPPRPSSAATSAGARAIQIFNQSPAGVASDAYGDEDVAALPRGAGRLARSSAVLIHAVYLLNCGSEDPEIRDEVARRR